MLTTDRRCTRSQCGHIKGMYRMIGRCSNCGQDDILMLFTATHDATPADCPVCGGWNHVEPRRLATADEIPAA